ncbi:MAG: hypothetical protein V1850_04320 [Candidatus Bathyarchaeota archaeon]
MSYAYTPGLKVKEFCTVTVKRRLPLPGEVLVKVGDVVSPDTIVARTKIPSETYVISIAEALQCDLEYMEEIERYMTKKVGDQVEEGEVIAKYSGWFGLSKLYCKSPHKGTLSMVSPQSGLAFIREPDVLFDLKAYIPGTIIETVPNEEVVIETPATHIQGIFGIGGETQGEIMIMNESQSSDITAEEITPKCAGKILVGRASVTAEALKKAAKVGVKGIIVGGVKDKVLTQFLGYEIGVAITGEEQCGLTFIITDGFGKMEIAPAAFALLKSLEGKQASINGATQIRAGVIRPEIIIQREAITPTALGKETENTDAGMNIGTNVRIICKPHFGDIGHISSLPVELKNIETESDVRVLEVELQNGKRVIIPRANVELIEE